MKAANVVKCGCVSRVSAMNVTFSRHARSSARLLTSPREYPNRIVVSSTAGAYALAPTASLQYRASNPLRSSS
jgi:hypothetical protein